MNKYTLGKQKTLSELCREKDNEIEALEQQLADLKASLPKVRADAVLDAIEENKCSLNIPSYREEVQVCYVDDLKEHADKLEAGNE